MNKNNKNPQRDSRGRFLPGNEFGKMPQKKLWSIEELELAIIAVEEEGDKNGKKLNLLKHLVKRAFVNDKILLYLVKNEITTKNFAELENPEGKKIKSRNLKCPVCRKRNSFTFERGFCEEINGNWTTVMKDKGHCNSCGFLYIKSNISFEEQIKNYKKKLAKDLFSKFENSKTDGLN